MLAYTEDMEAQHPRQPRPVEHPIRHQTNDDDYKAASKGLDESVDYRQFMPKLKAEHKTIRRIVRIVIILVVIAGLGSAAYYIGSHYDTKTTKPKKVSSITVKKVVSSPTQMYTSSNQDLTFTYPSDWKVAETATVITATSPVTKLTAYNRKAVDGRITLLIRAQNVALSGFGDGAAMTVLPSQLMTYASPASDQEGTAYLSLLNYAGSKHAGIDAAYITGNSGYQSDQYVPESVIQAIDPMISFTFSECANGSCSSTTPLTISTNSWNNSNFSGPLIKTLESLSIT